MAKLCEDINMQWLMYQPACSVVTFICTILCCYLRRLNNVFICRCIYNAQWYYNDNICCVQKIVEKAVQYFDDTLWLVVSLLRVPAIGHQVRWILWVQGATYDKGIGFLLPEASFGLRILSLPASVCVCVCVSVCLSVCQSLACPRDNSGPV